MINTVVAALTSTLLAIASPAAADTAKPTAEPAGTAISETAPASAPVAAKPGKPTRYCVEDTVTGSRLRQRFCQTREQWLAQGYDPLAKD